MSADWPASEALLAQLEKRLVDSFDLAPLGTGRIARDRATIHAIAIAIMSYRAHAEQCALGSEEETPRTPDGAAIAINARRLHRGVATSARRLREGLERCPELARTAAYEMLGILDPDHADALPDPEDDDALRPLAAAFLYALGELETMANELRMRPPQKRGPRFDLPRRLLVQSIAHALRGGGHEVDADPDGVFEGTLRIVYRAEGIGGQDADGATGVTLHKEVTSFVRAQGPAPQLLRKSHE